VCCVNGLLGAVLVVEMEFEVAGMVEDPRAATPVLMGIQVASKLRYLVRFFLLGTQYL
jgi:hypothetical protein